MIKNEAAWLGVKRLLALQSVITVLLSVGFLFVSVRAAYSAFLGGCVCLVPTWYFAKKMFRYAGARAAPQIMRSFYWGEAMKLVMTIGLFSLIFLTVKLEAAAFFVSLIVVQLSFWMAPWLFTLKQK